MFDLNYFQLAVVALCAMMIGLTKSGIPGLSILTVPLMATVLPVRSSVGVLLGILILGDLFAAFFHRRNANWSHVICLLPATLIGIVIGYFLLKIVTDDQLKPIIGVIILVMLVISFWRTKTAASDDPVPTKWYFATTIGLIAGIATMMANAAGPIMIIYLLAMQLDKTEFVGTRAWFFFLVNWVKVPFMANLQLMTPESVRLDLLMLPFIATGAVVGILLLKKIPQKVFTIVVQVLAAAAAVKLLF